VVKSSLSEAENIREVIGLSKEPFFGMHLGHAVVKFPRVLKVVV
jgi:hypothetical protein